MDNLRSILVIVDPTAQVHACVGKAARLARGFHARLTLLICDSERSAAASNFFDAETCDLFRSRLIMPHRELLETLAEPLRAEDLVVDTEVVLHSPLHAGMLRAIQRIKPDLVIKDTRHHSAIRRTLITNTDWQLIRECPAPLLLVKLHDWPLRDVHIAAAVDPGHPDDKSWTLDHEILGAMEYLATGLPAQCSVVNAFCTVREIAEQSAGGSVGIAINIEAIEAARQLQREALRRVLIGHTVAPAQAHLVDGAPVDALPTFVREQRCDLLIMGAIARGSLFNFIIGSSAERVLDRLECDVLVLKPAGLSATMWTG